MFNLITSILVCVGISPDQHSKITIRIKPEHTYSTIRYEYLVNYPGTKYVQSMGHFAREREANDVVYVSKEAASEDRASKLKVTVHNNMHIMNARFTDYYSRFKDLPMKCKIEGETGPHGRH